MLTFLHLPTRGKLFHSFKFINIQFFCPVNGFGGPMAPDIQGRAQEFISGEARSFSPKVLVFDPRKWHFALTGPFKRPKNDAKRIVAYKILQKKTGEIAPHLTTPVSAICPDLHESLRPRGCQTYYSGMQIVLQRSLFAVMPRIYIPIWRA